MIIADQAWVLQQNEKQKRYAQKSGQRSTIYIVIFYFLSQTKTHAKGGVSPEETVLTSLNMAFVPISCSRVKQLQIPLLKTLTSVLQFCVNLWVILGHFGKEIIFLN